MKTKIQYWFIVFIGFLTGPSSTDVFLFSLVLSDTSLQAASSSKGSIVYAAENGTEGEGVATNDGATGKVAAKEDAATGDGDSWAGADDHDRSGAAAEDGAVGATVTMHDEAVHHG